MCLLYTCMIMSMIKMKCRHCPNVAPPTASRTYHSVVIKSSSPEWRNKVHKQISMAGDLRPRRCHRRCPVFWGCLCTLDSCTFDYQKECWQIWKRSYFTRSRIHRCSGGENSITHCWFWDPVEIWFLMNDTRVGASVDFFTARSIS